MLWPRARREGRSSGTGAGERAVKLLPPMRHISSGCVTIEHAHRGVTYVGNLMEDPRRDIDRLAAGDNLSFLSKAHFRPPLKNKIDLFLLLIMPRDLTTAGFQRDMTHRKMPGLDGGCAPDKVLSPPAGRIPAPLNNAQVCYNH